MTINGNVYMKIFLSTCHIYFACTIGLFIPSASANNADPRQCNSCHQQAVSDWGKSDHAKAMDVASAKSVLGDFSGISASHFSQKARFLKEDNRYLIEFTEADKTRVYVVTHTFGHYPLQQYLIAMDDGRHQIFPFAWDSRDKQQGGQRWYPVYQYEDIKPTDRLHWQQPLQNWNGMCADCHSDGLKRNYIPDKNQFNTSWENINVGCQSCHGTLDSEHYKMDDQKTRIHAPTLLSSKERQEIEGWFFADNDKIASWRGEPRNNEFMDSCFACHSLRSPVTDGIEGDKSFLDQFSPSLLASPLYHPDGQIQDEVYVYGSFLQSKMFAAGVNCLDCHDNHTMKVKSDNNGLCLQCHNARHYQTDKHLNHPADSEAAQCVSCHMPQTTYMGVDARRDHSFNVPRPELTERFDVPNACNGCHDDKAPDWATSKVQELWGGNRKLSASEINYITLQHQHFLPVSQHLAIVNDPKLSEIVRASALALLPNSVAQLQDKDVQAWVRSPLPLIRLATAGIGNLLSPEDRLLSYRELLTDEFRAIRIAAASHLSYLGLDSPDMKDALDELIIAHQVSLWRGEGGLNSSIHWLNNGQFTHAIEALQHAIKVDPYFVAAHVNLADIYRMVKNVELERRTLDIALQQNPDSGLLHYSFAMHLIRQNNKTAALASLKQAVRLAPHNTNFAYLYFVALDNLGNTRQALSQLKMSLSRYQYSRQLLELGLAFARKMKDEEAYNNLLKLQRNRTSK